MSVSKACLFKSRCNSIIHYSIKFIHMKIMITALLSGVLFVLAACSKRDHCPEPPKADSTCDLMQATLFIDALPDEGGGLFSEYRKEYDNSGKVHKVVAAIYQLYLYD